jgi:hypothetical protein
MKPRKLLFPPWLIVFAVIVGWILSCTHTANIDKLPEVCFDTEVLPVFKNNCAISGCHDGTREGFAMNTYASISRDVTPGKPYSSRLYNAIIGRGGENIMPPSNPLTAANRTLIRVWIEQGANEVKCDTSTTGGGGTDGTLRACYSRDIQPVLTSHCAMTGCHDATSHAEGYGFYSYPSTMNAVNPGSYSTSRLYEALISSGEGKMPPASKPQLTSVQIDSIKKWIGYGALNETCTVLCDTISPVTFSITIWPIMQTSCTGCHGGASPSGGVSITGYTDVSALAASGSLMNSLRGNGVPRMPVGSAFTACRIRQFEIWVNNGHLNN